MPFITQGKTNWKFLLIVIVLAAIVGGGILVYQYLWTPKEELERTGISGITITSPVTGEKWIIGETYQIRWTPNDSTKTVGITLSDASKHSYG